MDAESITRVLVVEDEPDSAAMICRLLEDKFTVQVDTAEGAGAARKKIESCNYDIVTVDYKLTQGNGLDLLKEITASRDHPRVIFITGRGDERTASRAFRAGASDYVVKDKHLATTLIDAFQRVLAEASLKISQEALEDERAFTEAALNTIPDAFYMFDTEGQPVRWNEAFREMTGYSDREIASMMSPDFYPEEDFQRLLKVFGEVTRTGQRMFIEVDLIASDERRFPCMLSIGVLRDHQGDPVGLCGVVRDISEQKRTEAALHNVISETNQRREEITALLESTRFVLEHKEFERAARAIFELCKKLICAEAGYVALTGESGEDVELLFFEPEWLSARVRPLLQMPVNWLGSKAFNAGKAVFENAFMTSRWAEGLPEGHVSLSNVLMTPLIVEGKTAGVIALANKPGGFSSRDTLMASAFGEIASVALRNSRTLVALEGSEERYRMLVESAPDVIYSISRDSTLKSLNPAFEKITGWPVDEWMGRSFAEIVHPDDLPRAVETFEQVLRGESPPPYELRIRSKSGEYMVGEFVSTPHVKGGEVIGEHGMVRDITERKKAEQALKESLRRFHDVAENALHWIFEVDTEGAYTYVSPGVKNVLGYASEEMLGKHFFDFFHDAEREVLKRAAFEVIAEKRPFREFINRNVHKNGETVWLSTSGTPVVDDDGRLLGYRGVDTDITERKEWERELQMLNTELEGYAHAVSHDLKGPLSSIMAASVTLRNLLERDPGERELPQIAEMAQIIEANVEKSDLLIEDLLELAEAGQRPGDVSVVRISEVVERVLGERAGQIMDKGVKVELDDDLGSVVANPTHMYQLFSNLIDNAIKHNDSDKPVVTVTRPGEEKAGEHRYLVRENGSGFDPQRLSEIFKPFYSGKSGESGIGLATVQKVIEVYGGTIDAYNRDGACFEFVIKDIR